jgi:hypothetical protein
LYPDAAVAQILTAATYPVQLVEAGRWLQQEGTAARSSRCVRTTPEPLNAAQIDELRRSFGAHW